MENEISIYTPIILVFCLPILLIFMLVILKKISPGRRFKVSVVLIFIIWCFISIFMKHFMNQFGVFQWLAGMIFISAVVILVFMLWSVLCWGYTLSMLLCLAKNHDVNRIKQWEYLYVCSEEEYKLTVDRMQVLVLIRCAIITKEKIILTRLGHLLAKIFGKITHYMGVNR